MHRLGQETFSNKACVMKCMTEIFFQMVSLDTSALLRSSVFKKHPRQKVIAPPKVASQEIIHKL